MAVGEDPRQPPAVQEREQAGYSYSSRETELKQAGLKKAGSGE
jgi:hypothetical protein